MHKVFEGQYSGEKILLRTHLYLLFFFFQRIDIFLLYTCFSVIFLGMGWLFYPSLWWILAGCAMGIMGLFILHFSFLYRNTRYTITSRRCIFYVRRSLFKTKYNEIHLIDLRTAVPKRQGIGSLFGYGTLILMDKDEKRIDYVGMWEYKFVARYLSRVIDYIKIHGHTDDLSAYQTRKERKTEKKV